MSWSHYTQGLQCGRAVAETIADVLGTSHDEIQEIKLKDCDTPSSAMEEITSERCLTHYKVGDWNVQEYTSVIDHDCDGVSRVAYIKWKNGDPKPEIPETVHYEA